LVVLSIDPYFEPSQYSTLKLIFVNQANGVHGENGTFCLLNAIFWVIPRRLNFIRQHFGTLCLFHLHRQVGMKYTSYLPACEDGTECSEMSAYKIQTPGNYPEERHIKFRCQGTTQKKAYNIWNTAKV